VTTRIVSIAISGTPLAFPALKKQQSINFEIGKKEKKQKIP